MQVSRVCQSTGAVGSSADNTTAESFNTAFKRAPQRPEGLVERARARLDTFRRLTRYTTRRRHSHLGHLSPIAYEKKTTPDQQQRPSTKPHKNTLDRDQGRWAANSQV
ncbi:integrase core domain-containing protein [Streptomyces sp. 3211]|uniref:integrase core domain-containing protein n=1 Tax=Streptomyces sp. 3211 TaxID=1964449 RepID=UPI0009A55397